MSCDSMHFVCCVQETINVCVAVAKFFVLDDVEMSL
jgi:hypothetical protein